MRPGCGRNMQGLGLVLVRNDLGTHHRLGAGDTAHGRRADQPSTTSCAKMRRRHPAGPRRGHHLLRELFRDGFFRMETCAGNIRSASGRPPSDVYIALDFGIIGTLAGWDRDTPLQNFLAFFRRDCKRVAGVCTSKAWVPRALGSCPRGARSEPSAGRIARPLKNISFRPGAVAAFQICTGGCCSRSAAASAIAEDAARHRGLEPCSSVPSSTFELPPSQLHSSNGYFRQVGWKGLRRRLGTKAPRYAQLLPTAPAAPVAATTPVAGSSSEVALLTEQRRTNRRRLWWHGAIVRGPECWLRRSWCAGCGFAPTVRG